MKRVKSTPKDDLILVDESAPPTERESAASRLTFDGFFSLVEPELRKWLSHPNFLLRSKAIIILIGRMGKEAYFKNALEMLHSDKNWSVRCDAAYSLKQFVTNFRVNDQIKENSIKELLSALLSDKEEFVQQSSYKALLELIKNESLKDNDSFDKENDVDWNLLEPYLEKYDLQKPN